MMEASIGYFYDKVVTFMTNIWRGIYNDFLANIAADIFVIYFVFTKGKFWDYANCHNGGEWGVRTLDGS